MTRRLAFVLAASASIVALIANEYAEMWRRIYEALGMPSEVPDLIPAWMDEEADL